MSKCVTSKNCCEISNLIHEEVVVERRSETGLLQAALEKDPRFRKKLLLTTNRERAHISDKHLCDVSECNKTSKDKRKEIWLYLLNT